MGEPNSGGGMWTERERCRRAREGLLTDLGAVKAAILSAVATLRGLYGPSSSSAARLIHEASKTARLAAATCDDAIDAVKREFPE